MDSLTVKLNVPSCTTLQCCKNNIPILHDTLLKQFETVRTQIAKFHPQFDDVSSTDHYPQHSVVKQSTNSNRAWQLAQASNICPQCAISKLWWPRFSPWIPLPSWSKDIPWSRNIQQLGEPHGESTLQHVVAELLHQSMESLSGPKLETRCRALSVSRMKTNNITLTTASCCMEDGCLQYPGASTVTSRALDSIVLPWLAITTTLPWVPTPSSRHLSHWVNSGNREGMGQKDVDK